MSKNSVVQKFSCQKIRNLEFSCLKFSYQKFRFQNHTKCKNSCTKNTWIIWNSASKQFNFILYDVSKISIQTIMLQFMSIWIFAPKFWPWIPKFTDLFISVNPQPFFKEFMIEDSSSRNLQPIYNLKKNSKVSINFKDWLDPYLVEDSWRQRIRKIGVFLLDSNENVIRYDWRRCCLLRYLF